MAPGAAGVRHAPGMTPSEAWAEALQAWAIPASILAGAPEDPWVHPPALFRSDPATDPFDTPSHRAARRALGEGGTVLDVGVGGGRSSLPLAPPATALTGVDEQEAMLEQFVDAARSRGIPATAHRGRWPDVADEVPAADVVVCHHVVYNVAPIVPFLEALTAHARRLVVVELPERHPTSWMNPLWERFWSLPRPTEPSAALFVEVVRSLGWLPDVAWAERAARQAADPRSPEAVAFVRRRLCLPAGRDAEVADALAGLPAPAQRVATVAWRRR